jgi:hypothetical protein
MERLGRAASSSVAAPGRAPYAATSPAFRRLASCIECDALSPPPRPAMNYTRCYVLAVTVILIREEVPSC